MKFYMIINGHSIWRSLFRFYGIKKSFLVSLLFLVLFVFSQTVSSQCIGPYQNFESCKRATLSPFSSLMATDGWVFSAAGVTIVNTLANARSGTNSIPQLRNYNSILC
jgi:hypothetical protein